MATNTCTSLIQYQSEEEKNSEPFLALRDELAYEMIRQGKSESYPNYFPRSEGLFGDQTIFGRRQWIDHAAAQEFLDFVIATAPTYNVTIVATSIEDLPAS